MLGIRVFSRVQVAIDDGLLARPVSGLLRAHLPQRLAARARRYVCQLGLV